MKYRVFFTTELEIEAENVAHAFRLMSSPKKVRVIAPFCGNANGPFRITNVAETFHFASQPAAKFLRRRR